MTLFDLDLNRITPPALDQMKMAITTVLAHLPKPKGSRKARKPDLKVTGLVITAGFEGSPPIYTVTCSDNAEADLEDRLWHGLNVVLSQVTRDVAQSQKKPRKPQAPPSSSRS